jgi:mannose-1-phosphate guanylyltransferase
MDPDGRILRIAGRPGSDTGQPRYHFTGLHVIDSALFGEIPGGVRSEINREVYPRLIEQGEKIHGHVHRGFWRELGTPARYLQGSFDLLQLGDAGYLQRIRIREGVYSATPLGAFRGTIEPLFLGGAGVEMERDVFAAGAVLGDRVRLACRSRLTRCVIWNDANLGEDVSLDECIVAEGCRVPPRSRFTRKILLDEAGYLGDRKGLERFGPLLLAGF